MPGTSTPIRPTRTRPGRIHEVEIGGTAVQVTINELPDGRPGEVFISGGKQGSTFAGMCETVAIVASLALQHQVPIDELSRRLANLRFEPSGATGDPEIPEATSLSDYLARRLAHDYLAVESPAALRAAATPALDA